MPIFEYQCEKCKGIVEKIQSKIESPVCCGEPMIKLPTFPVMVKVMGSGFGGYPSRRKFMRGSAPFTSRATKVWGDYNPLDKTISPLENKKKDVEQEARSDAS